MKIVISVLLIVFLAVGWIAAMPKADTVDVTRELEIAREQRDREAYGSAIKYYRRAAEKDSSVEIELELYDAYVAAGKRKEARELLEALVEREKANMAEQPELVSLYGMLVDLYAQSADWESYIALAREVCAADRAYFDEYLAERYFANRYKPEIVSRLFLEAGDFTANGMARVAAAEGVYFLDSTMHILSGPYQDAGQAVSSVLAVKDDAGWRFVDTSGALYMASDTQYDRLWSGSGRYAAGMRDGKYYYLNDHCQEVLGPYDEASSFCEGVAAVRIDDEWFLIDSDGNDAAKQSFEEIKIDEFGYCSVNQRFFGRKDGEWKLYDLTGNAVSGETFLDVRPFAGGPFAAVELADCWAFVNASGQICCGDLRFEDARSAGAGNLAAVKQNGLWGYILGGEWIGEERIASWKMVIEPAYEDAGVFGTDNIAPVKIDGSWYYIRLMLH